MKPFSFYKNFNEVLITLLIVIFFVAAYFFMYVPQNERAVQEQRFRALQNIDKNVHAKIDNSIALMNNLLQAYATNNKQKEKTIAYINAYGKENFTLSLPTDTVSNVNTDSTYSVTVNNRSRQITISAILQKEIVPAKKAVQYQMNMKFSFEQFIKFLLPANVFDQYIVFSDGQVVYEDFSSGINYLNDSLSGKKGGVVNSEIISLNVSGKAYKLFFQPVSFTADKQLVVTGLLSLQHYQQEKNQLPSQAVLLLLTIVFIAILTYPWIKLYQMGNSDRLTITDGMATFVVSMLLTSLLIFSFVKYNLVLRPYNTPNSKDTLTKQIGIAFKNETVNVYEKLRFYDELVKTDSAHFFKDIVNLNRDSIAYAKGDTTSVEKLKKIITPTNNYEPDRFFLLDKNGNEKINWIAAPVNSPHGNFNQRNYFKNLVDNKPYFLRGDVTKPFYIDQVISRTTGVFNSVLAIPSSVPGIQAACLSFNMQSLQQPVLPVGYQFAIIDNSGQVLYHSQPARNLNENLANEFSANEALKSCIAARTKDVFTTNYFSRTYTVSVEPINNLPYFILIFEDTSYKETRDVEIYSFTFSMMLLMFAFLICQLFSVFFVSSKRSIFKKQLFDTTWIGPKISSYGQYNIATFANLVILLLAVIFFNFSTILCYLFILLFSIMASSIFLNSLFAKRYRSSKQTDNYLFKISTICGLCVFVIIINIAAIRTLDDGSMLVLWLYELLTTIVGYLLFIWGRIILNKLYKVANNKYLSYVNYAHSFALMVLTRLLLTSGLPMLFFYITSYNYEQNISIRYRHLQYANELPGTLNDSLITQLKNNNTVNNRYYYYDGAWIKNISLANKVTVSGYSKEEHITTRLLNLFRINISDKAVDENKFYTSTATDSSFFYNPLLKNACKTDSATTTYLQARSPHQLLAISATSLNYKLPVIIGKAFYNGWLFWLLLLIALIIFYFIIYNILNKLFCLKLPDLSLWDAWDDTILSDKNINNLLFIIGLPGSGKLSRVIEKIHNGELPNGDTPFVMSDDASINNVFIVDLITIPDAGDDREKDPAWIIFMDKILDVKNKLLIINHFEYNIHDAVTNRIKLNLLERIMMANSSKVIILSTIHPVVFLESFADSIGINKILAGQDLERWHVLFGHYRIVIFPLQLMVTESVDEMYKTIFKETAHTHFLNKMRPAAIDVANTFSTNKRAAIGDEMVAKLQITAHYFYMYIWQSLTKEEKFLLYDLAEDDLVNSFDDYNLNMLLAKGIIIKADGALLLFNKGFRNFILTAIGNAEVMKIKNLIKDNGNWSKLKNPLMIIIVAILVFLLISQEEAYSKLITYVATLGAGIPSVIKLFSLFDKTSPKQS